MLTIFIFILILLLDNFDKDIEYFQMYNFLGFLKVLFRIKY